MLLVIVNPCQGIKVLGTNVMQLVWNGYAMLGLGSFVLFYAITYTCRDVVNLSWKLI